MNGNSLAGESESAQEAYYGALDIIQMGASRNFPVIISDNAGIGTPSLIPDFIGSTDDGTDLNSITNGLILDNPQIINLTDGDTVTIVWNYKNGDQITAIFTVSTAFGWHVNFKSATKNGKPIDRNGNPLNNPNTAGLGGGSAQVPGFVPGFNWNFLLAGNNFCFASGSVTGPDGDTYNTPGGLVPC